MIFPRISGLVGHDISLEMQFYLRGVQAEPYCIRRIDIYRSSIADENKVAEIIIADCGSSSYPSPLTQLISSTGGTAIDGAYTYIWSIPSGSTAPEIYYDVWRYIGNDPAHTTSPTDDDIIDESLWEYNCGKFWVYPSDWYADDLLETVKYDFEPLDERFRKNEIRSLEVSVIPLPLYDYNYNKTTKIIPHLYPKITILTIHNELIVENQPMEIGLISGSYYDSPFVFRYLLNLQNYYIGTYKYRISITLPNGETIISKDMYFSVN